MNLKTLNAQESRKATLLAVARAFYNAEALTKVELQTACPNVNIDANVIGMLKVAGVLTSTRGRNAMLSMLVTPMHVFTHVEEFANKMVRPESYSLCVERRKAEKAQDLKEVIKRLKKENDDLSALLTEAWKELDVLKASNKEMSSKLEAIKAALR